MQALVSILASLLGDSVAPNMRQELKGGFEDGLLMMAACLAGLLGLAFGLLALFMALHHALGIVNAAVIMAALLFLACASVMYAVAKRRKRRAILRAAARKTASTDMVTLHMLLRLVRSSPLLMMALGGGIAAAGYVSRKRPDGQ